jgi:hypothetical protein
VIRAVVRLPADGVRAVPGSDRVTVTGIDHDGLVSVVPVTGDVQLDADELVSGRLSVRQRSGTLAATRRGPLAQIGDLAALGRAATANRTRIESLEDPSRPAGRTRLTRASPASP